MCNRKQSVIGKPKKTSLGINLQRWLCTKFNKNNNDSKHINSKIMAKLQFNKSSAYWKLPLLKNMLRSRFVKLLSEVLFRSSRSYCRQDFVNSFYYNEKLLELPEIFFPCANVNINSSSEKRKKQRVLDRKYLHLNPNDPSLWKFGTVKNKGFWKVRFTT